MEDIYQFIINSNASISEAMKKIDENTYGIVFLVDQNSILRGCLTDGDIRRALLAGKKMDSKAIDAANMQPLFASNRKEAKRLYHQRDYVVIPILDDDGRIKDLYAGEIGNKNSKPHYPLHIPVVINAGGRGTRLDPFTRVLPKPLIPVGDLPIIEHIMREYQSYDCNDFHIIVNYKRELLKTYFAEEEKNFSINWYDEDTPLGTGGGLTLLRGKISNTFFFVNCDVLLTTDYNSILKFHRDNKNVITMVCAYKNITIPYGVVEIGIDGAIEGMKEKPMVSFLTNTGVYIVEPEVIDDLDIGVAIGFPDIVEMERKKGKKVAVYPVSENDWMDMGQLSELEKMRTKLYGE